MRDITNILIFIFTNDYTVDKKIKAMDLGADMYAHHNNSIRENWLEVLEHLKLQKRWEERPSDPLPLLVRGDIILSPSRRNVFLQENKVSLTRLEFDILEYLMKNSGIILTHKQILYTIWGDEYEEASYEVLRNAIKRLREKLRISLDSPNYIECEREVGYFLSYNTVD
jgi:DNA-binding response OmpR family regulator